VPDEFTARIGWLWAGLITINALVLTRRAISGLTVIRKQTQLDSRNDLTGLSDVGAISVQ
jgi:hypothetical protein